MCYCYQKLEICENFGSGLGADQSAPHSEALIGSHDLGSGSPPNPLSGGDLLPESCDA